MNTRSILAGLLLAVAVSLASCGGASSKPQSDNSLPSQSVGDPKLVAELCKLANTENRLCPQKSDNGVVMESVIYNSNTFQYNYLLEGENIYAEDNDINLKNLAKSSYKGRPEARPFINALINTNSRLVFHYRTKGGKTIYLEFTPSELKTFVY